MKRLCALLRSLRRPREHPAPAGWERTWQGHMELNDNLDPPPAWDPCIVSNPEPRTEGE